MQIELQTDHDSWYGVLDAKKRKQIQNRLAQRARRKRLAVNVQEPHPPISDNTHRVPYDGCTSPEDHGTHDANPTDLVLVQSCQSEEASVNLSTPASISPNIQASLGSDHHYLTRHVSTVLAAMFNNGRILGLSCGIQIPRLSPPCTDEVPLSLHPTVIQMTVLHIPWIDRFPFAKMRDNAIRLSDTYYEEEFLDDLFTKDSFTIVPGSLSWDPKGWIITRTFSEKWGYLFK